MNRAPWFDAIFEPSAILVLVIAVFAGLLAAWWLFPVGLALWLFIVVRILMDPALRLNQAALNRKDLPVRFQDPFTRIQRIQINMFNTISTAPVSARRALRPVQAEVNRLVDRIYDQCKRLTPLVNYQVVSSSDKDLTLELNKANEQIANTTDPEIKKEYEETAQSLQARLDKIKNTSQQLDRFDAQLNSIENDLQVVLTDVIQIQSGNRSELNKRAIETADRVKQELKQFS